MKPQHIRYLPNLMGNRLRSLPLVVLYLTDGCNSRCAMCDIWRAPRRNMDMALVDRIVDDAKRLGTQLVLLSGGEAMQHPDWPTIANRFRAVGIKVWLLTNGLLLKKQAQAVIDHIDLLTVSLDAATPELYQHIRGVDALALLLEGIATISAAGIPTTTRTTVMRANFRQLVEIADVALENGASSVSFLAVDDSNPYAFGPRFDQDAGIPMVKPIDDFGALQPEELPEFAALLEAFFVSHADHFADGRIEESPAKLRQLYNYFAAPHNRATFAPPRCNAPHISAVINVDGTLQPCYFLPPIPHSTGLDAINDPAMLTLRKAYQGGQRPECERCVCPLYRGPRALLNGF